MAVLAAALQDRGNVLGEGHLGRRRRLLGLEASGATRPITPAVSIAVPIVRAQPKFFPTAITHSPSKDLLVPRAPIVAAEGRYWTGSDPSAFRCRGQTLSDWNTSNFLQSCRIARPADGGVCLGMNASG